MPARRGAPAWRNLVYTSPPGPLGPDRSGRSPPRNPAPSDGGPRVGQTDSLLDQRARRQIDNGPVPQTIRKSSSMRPVRYSPDPAVPGDRRWWLGRGSRPTPDCPWPPVMRPSRRHGGRRPRTTGPRRRMGTRPTGHQWGSRCLPVVLPQVPAPRPGGRRQEWPPWTRPVRPPRGPEVIPVACRSGWLEPRWRTDGRLGGPGGPRCCPAGRRRRRTPRAN